MVFYNSTGTSGSTVVWGKWCTLSDDGEFTIIETSDDAIWSEWVDCTSMISSSTTRVHKTWYEWNEKPGWAYQKLAVPNLSKEEKAERQRKWEEEEAERRRKFEEEEQERRIALEVARKHQEEIEKVAERLLLEYLDDSQREEYAADQKFHLISQEGRRYRVERKRSGNVIELAEHDGKEVPVARYCLHAVAGVPVGDDMLAALILLKCDEETYRKIANRTPLSLLPPPAQRREETAPPRRDTVPASATEASDRAQPA